MKVPLQIATHDRRLGVEIAGKGNSLTSGTVIDVPGGVRLEYRSTLGCRSVGIPEVLEFVVTASVNLELALFATWLYDKVKGRQVEKIVVRNTVVTDISEHGIRQVLEQEISVER